MIKSSIKVMVIVFGVLLASSLTSCKKESVNNYPNYYGGGGGGGNNNPYEISVTTLPCTDYGFTYFEAGGKVECSDQSFLKSVGLCYSVNEVPRYGSDFFASAGTAVGSFNVYVNGLSGGTRYFFRACAIDKDDHVIYGSIMNIVTNGTPTGQY